jgi:hypothetical protein
MDTSVLGLGAAAWSDAWKAAAPDGGLRLSIDPARMLELLEGLPISKALLADLQRAVPTGRNIELLVTADRQVAEVWTGGGRHVLAAATRDAVLRELGALLHADPGRAAAAPLAATQTGIDASDRAARPAGVLWQAPGAMPAAHLADLPGPPLLALALPWMGALAHLQVERDGGAAGDSESDGGDGRGPDPVFGASLTLRLPHLGPLEASIRACGNAVAVVVSCRDAQRVGARIDELAQGLRARGLECAHVGLSAVALELAGASR